MQTAEMCDGCPRRGLCLADQTMAGETLVQIWTKSNDEGTICVDSDALEEEYYLREEAAQAVLDCLFNNTVADCTKLEVQLN